MGVKMGNTEGRMEYGEYQYHAEVHPIDLGPLVQSGIKLCMHKIRSLGTDLGRDCSIKYRETSTSCSFNCCPRPDIRPRSCYVGGSIMSSGCQGNTIFLPKENSVLHHGYVTRQKNLQPTAEPTVRLLIIWPFRA